MKITLQDEDKTYTAKFDYIDVTVTELFDAFIGLMIANTFHMNSIEDVILDKAEMIQEKINKEEG